MRAPFCQFGQSRRMGTNKTDAKSNGGEPPSGRGSRRWWSWLRLALQGVVLAAVTGVVMALPLLPTGRVVLEEGDVASEDIRAPRRITYESGILRAEAQERVPRLGPGAGRGRVPRR